VGAAKLFSDHFPVLIEAHVSTKVLKNKFSKFKLQNKKKINLQWQNQARHF
jgi:hypothetical protein